MKKIFFTLALIVISLNNKAQSILDMASYHMVEGSTFNYAHDFSQLSNLYFNLPFADNFRITGTYLQFSLDYETFVWHIVKKSGMKLSDVTSNPSDQYIDFYITESHGVQTTHMSSSYGYDVDANGNIVNQHIDYWGDSSSGASSFGGTVTTYVFRVFFYR